MAVSPATPTGGTPTGWPTYQLPPAKQRRVPGWIVATAAVTAVLAVASFFTVLLWPSGDDDQAPAGPLTFQRFGGSVARIDFGQPARTTLTSVEGNNGYTAYESGGTLFTIAFDVTTGEERWRSQVTGSPQWSRLIAVPGALLVLALEDDETEPRRMYVLDAETGQQRWTVDVRGDDVLFFLDGGLGLLDHQQRALRGFALDTGVERWRHPFPHEEDSNAVAVLAYADMTRPSNFAGEPVAGVGDHRIVMVNGDQSVWLIDGRTGEVLNQTAGIADPDDQVLAYDEQLFVAPNQVDFQLASYDLAALSSQPQIRYQPTARDRFPLALEPCGADRICVLEVDQFNDERAEVVALSTAEGGGQIWRADAPEAERMIGVGDWVLTAASLGFEPVVRVFNGAGHLAIESPGLPIRLNEANFLVITTAGGYEDYLSAFGMALANGERFDLGQLPEGFVQEECSWNERYLVCPNRTGTEVWQFAREADQ
ncbi:MAG TPA: PQQ-binding-like beta-propeller repeat protein [Natronosporangium sp.]